MIDLIKIPGFYDSDYSVNDFPTTALGAILESIRKVNETIEAFNTLKSDNDEFVVAVNQFKADVNNLIQGFVDDVTTTPLTNYATAHVNAVITSADTIIAAMGKLQKQSTDNKTDIQLLETRVDTIITTPITSEAATQEVVDARQGEATVGGNITKVKNQVNENTQKLAYGVYGQIGKKAVAYAGVIRRDAAGWFYINDANHAPINLIEITETANKEIQISNTLSSKVGSLVVFPDETLAKYGLICGASVAQSNSLIKSYAPLSGTVVKNSASTVLSVPDIFNNSVTATINADGTGIDIATDGQVSMNQPIFAQIVNEDSAPFRGLNLQVKRIGMGSFNIRAFAPLYGYIAFDGTNWNAFSSCVFGITPSWNDVTKELVITHQSLPNAGAVQNVQSANVSVRNSTNLIHGRIVSVDTTTIKVAFYDTTGVKITTPSTDMKVYFQRVANLVPHTMPDGITIAFNAGFTIVRPENLDVTGGNLWIMGLHNM